MKLELTLHCLRCGGSWYRRSPKRPGTCPKCKSPLWDKPRTRDVPTCVRCGLIKVKHYTQDHAFTPDGESAIKERAEKPLSS